MSEMIRFETDDAPSLRLLGLPSLAKETEQSGAAVQAPLSIVYLAAKERLASLRPRKPEHDSRERHIAQTYGRRWNDELQAVNRALAATEDTHLTAPRPQGKGPAAEALRQRREQLALRYGYCAIATQLNRAPEIVLPSEVVALAEIEDALALVGGETALRRDEARLDDEAARLRYQPVAVDVLAEDSVHFPGQVR